MYEKSRCSTSKWHIRILKHFCRTFWFSKKSFNGSSGVIFEKKWPFFMENIKNIFLRNIFQFRFLQYFCIFLETTRQSLRVLVSVVLFSTNFCFWAFFIQINQKYMYCSIFSTMKVLSNSTLHMRHFSTKRIEKYCLKAEILCF